MENKAFSYLKEQIEILDIFKVLDNNIADIKKIASKFDNCDDILIFGTGGSSLGGKCLVNFQSLYDGDYQRVKFIENSDSRTLINTLQMCNPKSTGIIVISKSGRTTETLMTFMTLCELWKNFDYKNYAIAITEFSENNDLKLLAESKGIEVYEHNKNIGGRFSVFSIVGLLPAILQGVDIDLFIKGAKTVVNDIKNSSKFEECNIFRDITMLQKVFASGKVNQHVLMAYSDLFEDFGKWFAQLVGESLGKTEKFGITPIRAIGTVDQHSQLQLFLGGPRNKLFTVIVQKNNTDTPKIHLPIDSSVIKQLNGHSIQDLMLSHQKATIEVLRKVASVRVLEFEEFNIETIGFLMMLFFVEVITIAYLEGINPFDQPAVEESKKLVMKYLAEIK